MGLPTHPSPTVRARLQAAWSKAHKNFTGGYPDISRSEALAGTEDVYAVGGHADVTHGADGTVARAIDATADDRDARDKGETGGPSGLDGNVIQRGNT